MNNEIQNLINEKNALNNTIRLRRERHNQEKKDLDKNTFSITIEEIHIEVIVY